MQVFSPVNMNRSCAAAARGFCLVRSMDWAEWQLRHSSESLAFMRSHSRSAICLRRAKNFSRVSIEPKMCPHTSFEACILRAILFVHSWGTWQSGHVARTPERLVKWIVPFISSKTLVFISWQEVQNRSVLVASNTVLNPPQKKTPARKPPSVRKARLRVRAGVNAWRIQSRIRDWPNTRVTMVSAISALPPLGLDQRVYVRETVLNQRVRSRLRHVAGQACVTPRSETPEEIAVAILIMRDADHGRLALLRKTARVAGQAFIGVEIEGIAFDGVRDQRGLVRIVSAPAHIVGDLPLHGRS